MGSAEEDFYSEEEQEEDLEMKFMNEDSEMKQLFDEIVEKEKKLTMLQYSRKLEEAKHRETEAVATLKYAEGNVERERKKTESAKRRNEKLRETHRKDIAKLIGEKSALNREIQELNEKMEELYHERDIHRTDKMTQQTKIKMLEEDKADLQKQLKHYKKIAATVSKSTKEAHDDSFEGVCVHGKAQVFSPNITPQKSEPLNLSTIFDTVVENDPATPTEAQVKEEVEPKEEEEEIGFTSPPKMIKQSAITTRTMPIVKKKIPSTVKKNRPKVGKKKKKKPIRVIPVNGLEDFDGEENKSKDDE